MVKKQAKVHGSDQIEDAYGNLVSFEIKSDEIARASQ